MDWQTTFYILGSFFFILAILASIAMIVLGVVLLNEMKKAEAKFLETKESLKMMAMGLLNRRFLIAGAVVPALLRLIGRIFDRKRH